MVLHTIKSKTAFKIASNTFFQLLGKVITTIITVSLTVLITRNFGKVGYGEFNLMQSFPALFFIIADFGMNAIATRELTSDWSKANKFLSNILTMRLVISLIIIFGAGLSLFYFPYSPALLFGIHLSLLMILTQALFATTNIVYQVKLRYDYSTLSLICGYVFLLLFALLSIYLDLGIAWVNFSYVLGGLITFLISLNLLRKLDVSLKLSYDPKVWKFMFFESLPLGIMFIFSQVNFRADSIMLSVLNLPSKYNLNNTESVGIYGLAYKIFEVSLVIPTFFMNAVYPVYVKKMNESSEKLLQIFSQSLLGLLLIGLGGGLLGYFLSPFIIQVLGGPEFVLSVDLLRILLGGVFVFYLTQPLSWLIVTLGKQKYLPFIYLISALFNLGANYYFIPKYSFYASSWITIISETIVLILLSYFCRLAWTAKYAK